MINKAMQDALNVQINAEQYSAQLYLAMAAQCIDTNFMGFGHWLRIQASEETAHANKLVDLLLERGGKLELKAITAPPANFGTATELFEKVLEHEIHVTGLIHELFETARSSKDYACEIALQWFVSEQVEEEENVRLVVERLRSVGEKGGAIWYFDKEMGKRGKS